MASDAVLKRLIGLLAVRILHILDHSLPLHSGYTFRTASILKEQRALGWETFHLTSPKHGASATSVELVDGWQFYRTAPALPRTLSVPGIAELCLMRDLARRLHEIARQVQPNILHAHSPVLNAIPALYVGRNLGIPVVYEVRASWEDAAVDHGTASPTSLRYRASRALETWSLRRANAITTICEGLRNEIVARGIASSKVHIIPNAVDIETFAVDGAADPELRRALSLDGTPVIGFIGSFYSYEGLQILLRGFPLILDEMPDAKILLVGGGRIEGELKKIAAELGLSARIIFAGRVPQQEVPSYYRLIDVLVYPRLSMRLTELVTPLKPLEAMAQGRLVAASDVGGHRELIRSGSTGLLFKAGDPAALAQAVLLLLKHPERWSTFRAAARRFVETERTWKHSVAGYAAAYASALDKARVYT